MCEKQVKIDQCCYNQDAVVLYRLSNSGAFVFEFSLDAVIIKNAVLFVPIRYSKVSFKSRKLCNINIIQKCGMCVSKSKSWLDSQEYLSIGHENPKLVPLNFWRFIDFAENNTLYS